MKRQFNYYILSILMLVGTFAASAQEVRVPGNTSRWIDTGIDVTAGRPVQITATGTINVGTRGNFSPAGTNAFPEDRAYRPGTPTFPTDLPNIYGLVARVTSSRTNPDDEIRNDYAMTASGICLSSPGRIWLRVNDNQPADNSGEFMANLTLGVCSTPDAGGRSSRVRVTDESGANVEGAEVFVNGQSRGMTGRDGTLRLPQFMSGDRLIAKKLITENATPRAGHRTGSTQNWNYRVYLTTMPVNNDGSLSPFVVSDPTATQELRLNRSNPLFGMHAVVSAEWDASEAELRNIQNEISNASQELYNATDGQFFFEQVEIFDRSQEWINADFQVYTNASLRANADPNGFFTNAGGWMRMSRSNWSYVYKHEFSHYGLDLYDEYSDTDGDTYCTRNVTSRTSPYGWNTDNLQEKAACLMWNSAPKFCSMHSANSHDRRVGRGNKDCWTFITEKYKDPSFPERWRLQSPNTRGSIPGTIPMIPFSSPTRFSINNYRDTALCAPRSFVITDAIGQPLGGVNVYSATRYGAILLQGQTAMDNPMTPENETGRITATGLHEGDRINIDGGGSFTVSGCSYVSGNRQPETETKSLAKSFLPVSFAPAAFAPSSFNNLFSTSDAKIQKDETIRIKPDAFPLALSVEPTSNNQTIVRIHPGGVNLAAAPQVEIILSGENKGQAINIALDKNSGGYTGQISQLPSNVTGYVRISAVSEKGERVERIESFSLIQPDSNKEKQDAFSADGHLSFTAAGGVLLKGARLSISSSDAFAPENIDGLTIVGQPLKISASTGNKLNNKAVVRFQLPDQPSSQKEKNFNGAIVYDPATFEIRRYDEKSGEWKSVGGLLIAELSIVTAEIDELGSYLLVARPLSNSLNYKKKVEEKKVEETKPAENFLVTAGGLKAENASVSGKCPARIKFDGYITTNGAGTVKYTFGRSDGATAPVYTLDFTEAGTKSVMTDWMLGGAGLTAYEGWQTLKILSPNPFETSTETGRFAMKCEP